MLGGSNGSGLSANLADLIADFIDVRFDEMAPHAFFVLFIFRIIIRIKLNEPE